MAAWFVQLLKKNNQANQKKFDVTREEIMENREQAKCGNQIQILDSKVYLSKEKLHEGKQGQEVQVETMWMPSETEEDGISSLSGGTEFEMGGITKDGEIQRKDDIGESYEIRTEWIPENTNQTQATFYGASYNESSDFFLIFVKCKMKLLDFSRTRLRMLGKAQQTLNLAK